MQTIRHLQQLRQPPARGSGLAAAAARPLPCRRRLAACSAAPLPSDYGLVLASVAASAALVQWQALRVGFARREFNVPYPRVYAEGDSPEATKFNCMQRAHQNTLETLPALLAMEALVGLVHPIAAAAMGMLWNAGRVVYTLGYSTGDPGQRIPGIAVAGLTYVAFIAFTAYTGLQLTGLLGV